MAPDVPAGTAVWTAAGERGMPSNADWLAPAEADRASSMRFTKRRTEYLLRRWVCKQAVAGLVGLPDDGPSLAHIEVANLPGGAPAVLLDGSDAGVDVSLSDRAGWAVCMAGTGAGRLGCDLELIEPRSPTFVTDYLTVTEQAYVAELGTADQAAAVNLIWSAKESGLKVLRTGLRRDARSVEVVVTTAGQGDTGWRNLELHTAQGPVLSGWWRRAGSFLMTVAGDTLSAAPLALPGADALETAEPVHSWLEHPRSD